MSQARDEHHGDGRWVWAAAPDPLGGFKSRPQRLSLHDVDIPFDDVFQARAAGSQCGFDVLEDLFHLGLDVALSDNRPRGINRVPPM